MRVGFKISDESNIEPIVKESFTNAICYGQTGSGKTTGYILPNIENRIKLNHGILVYDFKGNLHEQVKYLAKKHDKLDDVFEIGKSWGESIDILKYTNSNALRSMFSSIAEEHSDSYWSESAYNLFENLYYLLKSLQDVAKLMYELDPNAFEIDYDMVVKSCNPTVQNLYSITKSDKSLEEFFAKLGVPFRYITTIAKDYLLLQHFSKATKQRLTKMYRLTQESAPRDIVILKHIIT